MTTTKGYVPEFDHEYTYVEGDRAKLRRVAWILWLSHNRGLWIMIAVQTVVFGLCAIQFDELLYLLGIPAMALFFFVVTAYRMRKAFWWAEPGREAAVGLDSGVLRIMDASGQLILRASTVRAVFWIDEVLLVELKSNRRLMLLNPLIGPGFEAKLVAATLIAK
jgi:hypothetical protein